MEFRSEPSRSERTRAIVALVCALAAAVFSTAVPLAAVAANGDASAPPAGRDPIPALADPVAGRSLDDYLAHALATSPLLKSARARSTASSERAAVVGSLPDPVVSYGYFIDEVETRVGPQEQKLGVRQTLPFFGKLSQKKHTARARAAAESERHRATRLSVIRSVTDAYCEYAYLARAVAIQETRVDLLRRLEGVVRSAYSAGTASYADLMKAQIALAGAETNLATAIDMRIPLSAGLAAAANLAADGPLPWPDRIPTVESAPSAARALDPGDVSIDLLAASPKLLALSHDVEAAEAAASLAGLGQFPDLTLGLDYIVTGEAAMPVDESGKDPLIASASLTLPIWFGARRAAVREADANETAARGALEQERRNLVAALEMALFRLRDAERRVDLYRDRQVPLARQSFEATEASYRGGGADFDSLVAAEASLLEFELALARARADRTQRAAKLDELLGRER